MRAKDFTVRRNGKVILKGWFDIDDPIAKLLASYLETHAGVEKSFGEDVSFLIEGEEEKKE